MFYIPIIAASTRRDRQSIKVARFVLARLQQWPDVQTELLDLLAPQFEEQMRQYKEEDGFIELVRRTIQDKLTGHRPSINAVSQTLHMGPRTLQRRLQESGSSFQRVLDEARHQMARYYLSNSSLELNEAAYLLGFEDPNSFGRAFRNWEGMPPNDWRETHRPTKVM